MSHESLSNQNDSLNTQPTPLHLHPMRQTTRERLEDIVVSPDCPSDILIKRLTDCYLGALEPVTNNPELDAVHRKEILSHPILGNNMFRMLLDGNMNAKDYETFLSEYNNGSMHAFCDHVLPSALKAHNQPFWKEYIEDIIQEESTPNQHPIMFEEFMNTCGIQRKKPDENAKRYAEALQKGYTADLPFAAGYALGVEVEAGYEIALLATALQPRFGAQLKETEWFNIHLAEDGEVEHARISVEMVENALASGGSMERVRAGFVHFCDDVNRFMEGVHSKLSAQ